MITIISNTLQLLAFEAAMAAWGHVIAVIVDMRDVIPCDFIAVAPRGRVNGEFRDNISGNNFPEQGNTKSDNCIRFPWMP